MIKKDEERQDQIAVQQNQIAELLQAIKEPPQVRVDFQQPAVHADVLKAEKVQKIGYNIIRSSRLKTFKLSADGDIKLFIKKFDEEIKTMKAVVGLNEELTKEEFVPILGHV